MKLQQIATALRIAGVPVLEVNESKDPSVEDDEIVLTPTIRVQVGPYCLGIVRDCGKAFMFYKERKTPAQLVVDYKQALADEAKEA
jgi:hypothetical protein